MNTTRSSRSGGDFAQTWKWLAEGWRHLSAKAANALTYFTPNREDEDRDEQRWGLLAVDVADRADSVVVELELPGLAKEDIDVSVEDHRLLVSGTKHYESERREGALYVTERAFGRFQRSIPLPEEVTAEGAEAVYKRGVLKLSLPKKAARSAAKITVAQG